jgi:ATP-dependent DNA helicase RecQ
MNRQEAEQKLKEIFKHERFYDKQWEVIDYVFQGKRFLFIQRTGYGKSLCFQFPAVCFEGTCVVFSPLIALMRNQVNYLVSLGISAACINSNQSKDENTAILQRAMNGFIKILYITPERQENSEWIDAVLKIPISMVVIDEAHCISVWGHDFRPAYRRLFELVRLLPAHIPVLATTATATSRVAKDIYMQLGSGAKYVRGLLERKNFHIRVLHVASEDEKLAWLADFIKKQNGTGILYSGTRAETEIYARWLQMNEISAIVYHAGIDAENREEIELGLMQNRWKCIVSTCALGMGMDKPDLRFIVHTQFPASLVHYYQEIGRGGRNGKPSQIVLLYSPDDNKLIINFIETARPPLLSYNKVIDALKQEALGERDLMLSTNLWQTQVRTIIADLLDQKIIVAVISGKQKIYEYLYGAPEFDFTCFEEIRQMKYMEMMDMMKYAESQSCRMQYICNYLDDQTESICGRCDICTGTSEKVYITEKVQTAIDEFRNSFFPDLRLESKRGPACLMNGAAAAFYGFSQIGSVIHKCKYENGGEFSPYLIELTVRAFNKKLSDIHYDNIIFVPPTESGKLVENFAVALSKKLKIPISRGLKKDRATHPQKVFQNVYLKKNNLLDAFIFEGEAAGRSFLLIDDIFDSGVTIREIGRLFQSLNAKTVRPLVIAKTIGGDLG